MINRIVRAIKLDSTLYEEVEADTTATPQALAIVVVVALLTGIGTAGAGLSYVLWGVLFGIVGWVIWAWIIYFVGTKFLPEAHTHANWGQMARGLGFAQSVGVLRILGVIPGIGWLLLLVVTIWQAVAMVIAVRQGLDYTSTWRAVAVVLIGFIPYAIVLLLISGPQVE